MRNFFIRNKPTWAVSGILISLTLIWLAPHFLGWDKGYSFTNELIQLLLTSILGLVVGFIFYIQNLKRPINSNQQNESLDVQQNSIVSSQAEFKQVMANLKNLFKSWGKQCHYFLRKSPWYVIIGKEGSGKSNLVNHVGLNFIPSEHLNFNSMSATYPHTWQFAKEAVILELPFGSSSKTENKAAEVNFLPAPHFFLDTVLKFIKHYRRKNPLNGIIATYDLSKLLTVPEALNLSNQIELKTLLHRIYRRLKMPSPLYLVLTQCDKIAGFNEFFSNLSKDDREQLLGIVFPKQAFNDRRQAVAYFNQEFDRLIESLNRRLLWRLNQERNSDNCAVISYFPQQLQLCKHILADYLLQDDTTQLRGIYFVSSIQEGKVDDCLMNNLSTQYQLDRAEIHSISQKKSFFIKNIFSEAILPETNWIYGTSYWNKHNKLTTRICWGFASMLVIVGFAGFAYSYLYNQENINSIEELLPVYHQNIEELNTNHSKLEDTLPLLNTVKNIQEVYGKSTKQWLTNFEMVAPDHIQSKINLIWQDILQRILLPHVFVGLEETLRNGQQNPETLYQALKGYLVFDKHSEADPSWLLPPFTAQMVDKLKNQPDEQRQFKEYLSDAITKPILPEPLNHDLITHVRQQLKPIPPVQFAYYEMKQTAEHASNQFSFDQKVGANFSSVFAYPNNVNEQIPALYTYDGFRNLQGNKSIELIKNTAETYRIIGINPAIDSNRLHVQMTPELWALYGADFSQYWHNVLTNIHVSPFSNLSQGIQSLAVLTSVDSPLLKVLLTVKENTALIQGHNLSIIQQFSDLNSVTGIALDSNKRYTTIRKNLLALRSYFITLNNSPNISQAEFADAKAIVEGKLPNNPIVILRRQAEQLPAPLNQWLNQIADNSLGLLLQGAHQTISAAWQTVVFPPYQSTIQGRFPFGSNEGNAVNMNNFGLFFGGSGVLSQFYQTYLAAFIDSSNDNWKQYQIGNYSLGLNQASIDQLHRAYLIRTTYFHNGENNSSIQFSIKPRFLDPESSSISLQIANQSLMYRHGPPQLISFHWPFQSDTQQVSVSFTDFQDQNYSRTLDGTWAWFQLLNSTELRSTDNPGHYIWTVFQGRHKASFDILAPNNLPVFNLDKLKGFELPERI